MLEVWLPECSYDSDALFSTGCQECPHARQWHQVTVVSPRSTCSTVT